MRKTAVLLLALALLLSGFAGAVAFADGNGETPASASVTYGTFFAHLLDAYDSAVRIDADAAALDSGVARAIAAHWKTVYLGDYQLYHYGVDDPAALPITGAHAFVVLGYELKNGEMTAELKGRCDAAAAAAMRFPDSILVCTGGATGSNNPERHTEAGLMKAYLADRWGIAPERIFTDELAMTTAENAVNTLDILREQGVEEMTIVTSTYHQRWSQVLFNALAAQYQQKEGYSAKIVGNYCFDIAPANPLFWLDARIAVLQLGSVLGLSSAQLAQAPISAAIEEKTASLPYWTEDSAAARSILAFANTAADVSTPAWIAPADRIAVFDFEGTLFGEGFYLPMTALVKYLSEKGFTVFISGGSERARVRELIRGTLGEWVPPYHVICGAFALSAGDEGGTSAVRILDEIGQEPVLVFGSGSGDIALLQYAVQHGGKAYMLLPDDPETASDLAAVCLSFGIETVSMGDDFATVYGETGTKVADDPAA